LIAENGGSVDIKKHHQHIKKNAQWYIFFFTLFINTQPIKQSNGMHNEGRTPPPQQAR
jgi:hypothetical protein